MYSQLKLFLSLSVLCGALSGVMCSNKPFQPKKTPKLFVFGDSYADVGNMKHDAVSWKSPYGITFPGKPSGRFSDGLIATDFLEKVFGAESPYLYTSHGKNKRLQRGMNFAFGGSSVFDSSDHPTPNISAQVNLLVDLFIARHVYTFDDLTSSDIALVLYSGIDYFNYISQNPRFAAVQAFVDYIVEDLNYSLLMLDGLNFNNIAITSMFPLGCLPHVTLRTSFQSCNESYTEFVKLHNDMLKNVVAKLNKEARLRNKGKRFFIIDLYKAFMNILNKKGNTRFKTPLKPCCEGDCARVDMKGTKKYKLCDNSKFAFFWDELNPTEEGWRSISSVLGNPLANSMTKV